MRRTVWLAVALACLVLACCGSAGSPGAPLKLPGSPRALRRPTGSHFVLIVLENRELGEVIGDATAPYLQALAHKGVLATDYHAIAHPSLPNYISLLAGGPLGIASDCTNCQAHGTTLIDQLEGAHVGWRAYMEGMPAPCYHGAESGGYAKRHDPFMYFPQIASNPSRCRKVVPLADLASDLRRATLPPFAWVSPNLCDDGHDCANASVSRFLARLVPYLLASLGPAGTLAVVWDEGSSDSGCCGHAAGGRVPLILLGPRVVAGAHLSAPADHYSLLALIEDSFGLARLRGAACACTPSLDGAFQQGSPPLLARARSARSAHFASGRRDSPAT